MNKPEPSWITANAGMSLVSCGRCFGEERFEFPVQMGDWAERSKEVHRAAQDVPGAVRGC
jgi:hypothetical protein